MSQQTLAEKILSHVSNREVHAGDLAVVPVARAMTVDSIALSVMDVMKQLGCERVHDPDKIALFVDHVAPASNVATADAQQKLRAFAEAQGIRAFYDVGSGICHQVMIEEKLVTPGTVAVGSDSHSTAYGMVGTFGTGMGSTDVGLIFATGKTWLRVPETLRVDLRGKPRPYVMTKDIILRIIRDLKVDGGTYKAMEYHGVESFSFDSRFTLASMSTELGAKVGLIEPDEVIKKRFPVPDWLYSDADARYLRRIDLDVSTLDPQVAAPNSVDNVHDVGELKSVHVDTVFLGSCTNARLEDLQTVARIVRGKRIAKGTRLMVTPASRTVLMNATNDGTLSTLLEFGAALATPGCGACMGRSQGVLGAGEVCFSTGNRNFRGRMGSPEAKIYLGSPAVAAATALTGFITDPSAL
ncbi:MAG: 3-isopropylmalate dehydratase large subunit [Acidobacteriia bacterium]|nr:3-isopropylmalate dehydratase large subunit [Terriglobia bacterium]